jgi:hypothetical protein
MRVLLISRHTKSAPNPTAIYQIITMAFLFGRNKKERPAEMVKAAKDALAKFATVKPDSADRKKVCTEPCILPSLSAYAPSISWLDICRRLQA